MYKKDQTMLSLVKTIKNTDTPPGTAALWWLGQMGVCIKMGETILAIDYYACTDRPRIAPPPVPRDQVRGIDVFLGTHNHIDHIDWPSWKIWSETCPDAKFIIPAAHMASPAATASGIAPERFIGINDGETIIPDSSAVTIHAIPAAHEFLDPDPETGNYPCLQYIIEGNGVRIYHAGDTLRYEGMLPRLQQFGHFDAAILPINGRDAGRYRRNTIGNMTFQEAVDLTGELQPGLVIPGHWDLFAHNSADPAAFADYLDAKYGGKTRCVIPEYGEQIIVRQLLAR